MAIPVSGTRIPCYLFEGESAAAQYVARLIAHLIQERSAVGRAAVLGLSAGSALVGVYRELIRLHQEEDLDFSRVVVFNVEEFYGLGEDRLQSLSRWLREHFLSAVKIPSEQVHLLDGTVAPELVEEYCYRYEDLIRRAGGLDFLLLTIGRNGRIAGNEPFGVRSSRTRLAVLDPVTRRECAADFFSEEYVPLQKLTVGIETILSAREIAVVGHGEEFARAIRAALEEPISNRVPASFLQDHRNAAFYLDEAAAAELTAAATPWLLGTVQWTDETIKRAVLWLSQQTGKALLKLEGDDFRNHNLHQLLRHHGPASRLAHRVFRQMMETINYHPAGREPCRVLIFSPHPDDDVICMGGTMIRLVEDGHEVHVAYMVSGNIAVFDHDAEQLADLVCAVNQYFGIDEQKSSQLRQQVRQIVRAKQPGDPDDPLLLELKALIRWSEARAAATVCGVREENLHFLDLPFYRTGTVSKRPAGPEDVAIVRQLIQQVTPAQIYVAGDLSDPHGTHRVCARLIFQALQEIERDTGSRPEVLLYRGAWQEWAPHQIDVAVPLSPQDLKLKKEAIFRHESQKDTALFPGPDDPREFWQRAEERNRQTAAQYNQFGLPEYFAIEAFRRWRGRVI
jgi:glucosamine-6-phosphate deaminase